MCPCEWGLFVTACVWMCPVQCAEEPAGAFRTAHVLSTSSLWELCLFSSRCRCMCPRWWRWPLWLCGRPSGRCSWGESTPAAPRPCTSWKTEVGRWDGAIALWLHGGQEGRYSLYFAFLRRYLLPAAKSELLALDDQLVFGPQGCRGGSHSGERELWRGASRNTTNLDTQISVG